MYSATKTSTGTGNWNTAGTWTPSGVPASTDDVIITSSHVVTMNADLTCKSVTVGSSASLSFSGNKTLTISGAAGLTNNGIVTVSSGNLLLSTSGATFSLSAGSTLTWNPSTNTLAAATLFTNGAESFASTSNLIMSKWYDMNVGLGTVVGCNFGNLKIMTAGTWHMNNSLQTRSVIGALTIQSSYVILDESSSISTTNIGSIVLANSSSYLDFIDGTHSGSFTVNTASINITGGELDCMYLTGTGNCTLNVSGNVTLASSGKLMGTRSHNGNTIINISGNLTNTSGTFYGSYFGNGNSTVSITGSLSVTSGSFFGVRSGSGNSMLTVSTDMTLTAGKLYGSYSGSGNSTISISGNLTLLKSGATYSEYYNIVDGNGTATTTITGNYSNQGYFDLIWNTGVSGVGNGNSSMTVGGTFTQSDGDFRGVWNLTTTNAGTCSITMNNINFTGGVFMVYYAVSSTTITNTFLINGNLSINSANSSDVFRGIGLGVLSSINNAATINTTITGTTSIAGNSTAEFSNNVGFGNETLTTTGNITLTGGTNKFHNGNHTFTWNHAGNISISGGTNYFSSEAGVATTNISGNLTLSGGILSTKSKGGASTVNITGSFSQTGGTLFLFNNSTTSAAENISLNIAGDFSQTAGIINYSDNSSSTGVYSINLTGNNYTIGGTGSMTSASAGSGTLFGFLNFNKAGTITFTRSATTHSIQQVKQTINNGCTLLLNSGNLQVASSSTSGTDYLTIANGGILNTGTNQILSNGTATNSGINVASGGTIKTANVNGLYDGTTSATINFTGNMNFNLNANSTIEYNGVDNQIVTGLGAGVATQTQHKYGILKINFGGTTDVEYTNLTASTNVRTQLILTAGELKLNNYNLIVEDGSTSAITRTSGYIKSETNSAINNSIIKWMNMSSGAHIFPFAVNSTSYIPVTFSPSIGTGGYVEISTRGTGSDNTPFPGISNVGAVTNINRQGTDVSADNVIDRWWVINAPGFTSDVTLSYRGSENSTSSANANGNFAMQYWDGTRWSAGAGTAAGVTSGIGTISIYGTSNFSPFLLVSTNGALPIKLLNFDVKLLNDEVAINWSTASEKDNDFFNVERSEDGKTFHELSRVKGAGTSHTTKFYNSVDNNPAQGKSYYRLKQTDFNGAFTYSPIRVITNELNGRIFNSPLEVLSFGPNPFKEQFTVNYKKTEASETRIMIINMGGQIVFDETRNDTEGSNSFDFIDDKNLAPGNYILNLVSGSEKITRKIVKTSN